MYILKKRTYEYNSSILNMTSNKWKADRVIIEKFDSIDYYWNIYNFCGKAGKIDGLALQYVNDQTSKICLAAVKQTGIALQYVNDQTSEICLIAIKQNGIALQYVNRQTSEICLIAKWSGITICKRPIT